MEDEEKEERERDGQGHCGSCLYDQEQGVLTYTGRSGDAVSVRRTPLVGNLAAFASLITNHKTNLVTTSPKIQLLATVLEYS